MDGEKTARSARAPRCTHEANTIFRSGFRGSRASAQGAVGKLSGDVAELAVALRSEKEKPKAEAVARSEILFLHACHACLHALAKCQDLVERRPRHSADLANLSKLHQVGSFQGSLRQGRPSQ